MWDNNHHRDFHTRVNAGKDQSTLEEEAYRQLLSNSLEADTEAAQRAGAHPACMCLLTYQATRQQLLRSVAAGVVYLCSGFGGWHTGNLPHPRAKMPPTW